ncbi:hypothetical protein B9479_008103 [Cryptococcus floricola]|uniref:C2H2-type domain-containing protein n=1 Tax=Cryptococcus floricola TaxID=2591691 RepID=A0A5D3AMV2_9TREE|nr:hypothetical protein B9479_008103 [Cryptococcus floricola]
MPGKANNGVRTDGPVLSYTVIHLPNPPTHSQSRLKLSSNDNPKQTSLEGRFGYAPSSAASQPSTSNQPVLKKTKRVAASSLQPHGSTSKKSRVRGGETNVVGHFASSIPPAPETAPRPSITSPRNELDSEDTDDYISSDDDDGDDDDGDDGSGNLNDVYARFMEAEKMPPTSLPVAGDDFWVKYLLRPLEKHASRLGKKPTPLLDITHKRLKDVLDFVLASKGVYFIWTACPMSEHVRERLLQLWGLFMPANFQELLAGPKPPSGAQIRSLIEANGVYCNNQGVRLDKIEGRGEVQRRCVGAYWKVALPKGDVDSDDTDQEADDQEADDQEANVHHHPPPPIRLYTGQTAKVSPSDNTMGFRARWIDHVREAYGHDEAVRGDSHFTKAFIKSREASRMAFAAIVTVPVPVGTKLDIPFRNAAKFFARLSEAVCHEAFNTIYHAAKSRRTRDHRTFWLDRPRDYVGMNAQDPLREGFGFWELDKPQRPSPKCAICDKLFSTKSSLADHKAAVHGPKTFVCEYDGCVNRYGSETRLNVHRKQVHGNKEHACDGCESTYGTVGKLNAHKKQVHGNKEHACDGCERTYGTIGQLNAHKKQVHGNKEHACDGCERTYGTIGQLNVHRKEVHGNKEHACDGCERKFGTLGRLNVHKKQVHGDKEHACDGCEKKFGTLGKLNDHMKKCHPERKYR